MTSESPSDDIQGEGGESNSTCMICMEEWTIGSDHRLCCLKCGHMFGRSCIERWIKEKGSSAKCPTCNKATKRPDLRDLWCKTIHATDTSELCHVQQELANERKLRKTDSAVIFHQNLKLEMLHEEVEKLKRNIIERDEKIFRLEALIERYNKLRAQKLAASEGNPIELDLPDLGEGSDIIIDLDVQPTELKGMFHFVEKVETSASGGCRLFALCPTASIILVAQPGSTGSSNIFGSYGLRKYSTIDTSVREFIPLHNKTITSIQLKPFGDLILTSSQDKRVRLTSISNNTCIQTYQCQYEPTCVSWSAHRDQQFYVASGNCYVTLFDIRNTSEYIYQTNRRVANTRLLSIASTCGQDNLNGLIVNDSRGSQFLEISENSDYDEGVIDQSVDHLTSHQLPFEGLMGTADYDKRLNLALITTRRTPLASHCCHNLVKLQKVRDDDGVTKVECQHVRTFNGGSPGELLSQSRILRHPTLPESVLVGACDQDARGIKLWDSSDNSVFQTIKSDFIRDMIVYTPENTNQHILYSLSEKGIGVYRWDYA